MNRSVKRQHAVAAYTFAIAAVCALLLALPGETVTTKYMNDLFVFLDGVHRIDAGQVPNRDFHTALGPLVYYIPALGYWISGSMGGAMPVGMALLILALAPIAAHITGSRLRPIVGVPLAGFLLLVVAVPINIGESIGALSFGMFYNRIGWAALGFLLTMYVRPLAPQWHLTVFDAACAAALVLLMLYTKISYAAVGVGFLVFMLFDKEQRRWAGAALALVPLGSLVVELFWGGTAGHIEDLRIAARVSGGVRNIGGFIGIGLRNAADLVLFSLMVGLFVWRTRSILDVLFLSFCAGAGWILISQNFQQSGIITLGVGAAVAAEILLRQSTAGTDLRRWPTIGAYFLLLGMLLPMLMHNAAALGLHGGLAAMKHGEPVPLPKFERIRLARLWFDGSNPYPMFARYMKSLQDGASALASMEGGVERVLVLDFVTPFTAGLGLTPPRGDSSWHHWGRTIDEKHFLPAEELFGGVRVVMEPRWAVEESTALGMRKLYGDYVADHYEVALKTVDWKIHLPRRLPAANVSRPAEEGIHVKDGAANGG